MEVLHRIYVLANNSKETFVSSLDQVLACGRCFSQFGCTPHGFSDDHLEDFQENSAAIFLFVNLECFAIKRTQEHFSVFPCPSHSQKIIKKIVKIRL